MKCPGCSANIPDMAKFCPECGMKLTDTSSSATIEDSVVTRSPGAGSNYSPVINVSSSATGENQKSLRCVNCDMEISKDNKPLVCMECGAKFCENCEGFYRHEVRQRGEKPLCYKCYTTIYGELGKEELEARTVQNPAHVEENLLEVRCPNCGTLNNSDSMFCVICGAQISPKAVSSTFAAPASSPSPQVAQPSVETTSAAWWLLPLFMTWVGGLIAFLVLRDNHKSKAKNLLIFGIVMTAFWIVVYIILVVAGGIMGGY